MLDSRTFYDIVRANGISLFTGVPDSLLAPFCSCVESLAAPGEHVCAANEGAAVALAAGHFLGTGAPALVYMQNSGLGNAVNPLASLASPEVAAIPMVLLVGWRGSEGRDDEPQHLPTGRITLDMLDKLDVDAAVLPDDPGGAARAVESAVRSARHRSAPSALVVRRGTFAPAPATTGRGGVLPLSRDEAIDVVLDALDPHAVVVATTGYAARELHARRRVRGEGHDRDFLNVGAMGHASSIALGLALARPDRTVWCLDGDGALLMHMGALAVAGTRAGANFRHIVMNNGVHDSVGGQATAGHLVDFPGVARACGYTAVAQAAGPGEVRLALAQSAATMGPAFLEIRVRPGASPGLERPTATPLENRRAVMAHLGVGAAAMPPAATAPDPVGMSGAGDSL